MVVNDGSALRKPWVVPSKQTGKGMHPEQPEWRVKKNRREKAKRDGERSQMERMSRLFRAADSKRTWTRVEILNFCEAVLFWWIRMIAHQVHSSGPVPLLGTQRLLARLRPRSPSVTGATNRK